MTKDRYYEINEITTLRSLGKFLETNGENLSSYEWLLVTKNPAFNLQLAEKYSENVDWDWISVMITLNVSFIEKFLGMVDLYAISKFQPLTYNFIMENKEILSMEKVIENPHVMKLDQYSKIKEIYEKMRLDEKCVEVWVKNLRSKGMIRPSEKILEARIKEFYDYIKEAKKREEEASRIKELVEVEDDEIIQVNEIKKPSAKEPVKEEKPKVKRTRKPKEEKVILPDFDKMSKAELQEYVKARGIRVYYHDTIAILKDKAVQKI